MSGEIKLRGVAPHAYSLTLSELTLVFCQDVHRFDQCTASAWGDREQGVSAALKKLRTQRLSPCALQSFTFLMQEV
jgi:hypothetical protein